MAEKFKGGVPEPLVRHIIYELSSAEGPITLDNITVVSQNDDYDSFLLSDNIPAAKPLSLQMLAYRLLTGREGEVFFSPSDPTLSPDTHSFITSTHPLSHPFITNFAHTHQVHHTHRLQKA